MEGVLALLSTSADQSAILQQMGQSDDKDVADALGEDDEEIIHNGKKY